MNNEYRNGRLSASVFVLLRMGNTDIPAIRRSSIQLFTDAVAGSTFPTASFATAVSTAAAGVGADASAFGWTLAKAKGLF